MNDFASPWATGSNRSTPQHEAENPFAYIPSTLAPNDALVDKTSKHKANESVWSTFTNDASVWSDGVETSAVRDVWDDGHAHHENTLGIELGHEGLEEKIRASCEREEEQELDAKGEDEIKSHSHEDSRPRSEDASVAEDGGDSDEVDRNDRLELPQTPPTVVSDVEDFEESQGIDGTQDVEEKLPQTKLEDEEVAPDCMDGEASKPASIQHGEIEQGGQNEQVEEVEKAQPQQEFDRSDWRTSKDGEEEPTRRVVDAEDAYHFKFDQNLYDKLFPSALPTEDEQKDLGEPDDQAISSTSERKAWYRISRAGTMREHDNGDINYIRVVWRDSAVQRKAIEIVERWIQEDRSTVGSNLFSTTMKSSAAFNWSDAPTSPNARKPSISHIKTHSRQTTQTSITPSTATARSSLHSDRGVGLGFSWSSEKTVQDPPTPPSSAGLAKSPSIEFKPFKFETVSGKETAVQEVPTMPTPAEAPVEDEDDDFGDFEESSPIPAQAPSIASPMISSPVTQVGHSSDFRLSLQIDSAPQSSFGNTYTHNRQTSTSSVWDVLEPTRSPIASPRTSMWAENKSPVQPAKASIDSSRLGLSENLVDEDTDPWGALGSFEQARSPSIEKPIAALPPPTVTIAAPNVVETETPTPLEIIQNLPDLSFMLL